jgi:dienelactone hydrolase
MRIVLLSSIVLLGACSSARVSVTTAPSWPFQQIEIGVTGERPLVAYYTRPEATPRALAVVIQNPACVPEREPGLTAAGVSTSGVLWKQLSQEFVFVQLESVGVRQSDPPATPRDCSEIAGGVRTAAWAADISRVVEALRRHEHLEAMPTVYLGIGAGATPAALLAARDRNTSALVLLNAAQLHAGFDEMMRAFRAASSRSALDRGGDRLESAPTVTSLAAVAPSSRPPRERLLDAFEHSMRQRPVLIVHGGSDAQAPAEGSLLLFSELLAQGRPARMLVLHGLGHDLGLGSERPECFDASIRLIVSRLRTIAADPIAAAGQFEQSDCEAALTEFPEP